MIDSLPTPRQPLSQKKPLRFPTTWLSFVVLALVVVNPTAQAQDTQAELKKMTAAVQSALDTYCLQARKINGSVSTYELDGDKKKLLYKRVIKSDKTRYLTINYNGSSQFINAELFRVFGDMRQVLQIEQNRRTQKPARKTEKYAKVGEKSDDFLIEENRGFAYESPSTSALRPVAQLKLSFLDLLEYPAFKVTSIEQTQADAVKIVKVTFTVDQELNAKQTPENRLDNLQQGWIEVRPDHFWTIHRAEYTIQMGRQGAPRKWKIEYTYDSGKHVIPLPKELKMTTIDPKDKTDVKPISQLHEFDFKIIEGPLPDDQFGLSQFELAERYPEDFVKEWAAVKKKEQDEINNSAPTPPGGFPLASGGLNISPWAWLGGGLAAFLLFMIALFRYTAKNKNPA